MKTVLFPTPSKSVGTLTLVVFAVVASTENVSSATLSAGDLSAMTQSTVSDSDVLFFWQVAGGSTVPQTVAYSSTATPTTWSGTVGGILLGQVLNVGYLGTTVDGTVGWSWTTSGSFGSKSVTGNGSTSISYPTPETFTLLLAESLQCGSRTYAIDYSIPGSFLPDGSVMFGTPGNPEVGAGTTRLDGIFVETKDTYSYLDKDDIQASDKNGNAIISGGANNKIIKTTAVGGGIGTITIVPEPTAVALLGLGIVGLLACARERKPGNHPRT